MLLYLIRHGITDPLSSHLYYGVTDVHLSEGEEERLNKVAWKYPKVSKFYTSSLIRTKETLLSLYKDAEYEEIPEVNETNFGIFEMKSYEEIKDSKEFQEFVSGDFSNNRPPKGESFYDVQKRAVKGVQKILDKDEDCLLVAHGGSIMGIMLKWFPDVPNRHVFLPSPACGFKVVIRDKKAESYEIFAPASDEE